MTIIDAIYRELRFGLCGTGGALENLVAEDHIKQDMRNTIDSGKAPATYPWIIFRRITESENNQIRYSRERFEIEIIGLRSSPTKGDGLIEQIKDAIKDHFAGKLKTFGKFTSEGMADPDGGLKLKSFYSDTTEGYDVTLTEKAKIMVFFFSYIRRPVALV
ncbi:MAG: hypothetical protein JWP89_2639 [Schlesneria sp.]|nr:hypothetical protein [Schlesneria sp.]